MRKGWRSLWFLVGFLPLVVVLWLAWVLPGWGFFRLDTDPLSLPQDGMVLVERQAGKVVSSSALASYGIGWQVSWEMWPLVLLCVLSGYSLGVGYHWLYRLLDGEQPPAKEVTAEEITLRELAESQRHNLQAQQVEIKNLRTMLQQARKESFDHMMKSGERGKQIMMLERKVESQQRELFNARAKMKRLAGKQRRKPVDQPLWPEYSDDMERTVALCLTTHGSARRAGPLMWQICTTDLIGAEAHRPAAVNSPTLKSWGRIGKVTSRGGSDYNHRPRHQLTVWQSNATRT